ncbi:MAG: ankyrin repeat family protein [Alphaproteobacteria bacterium]|jgi:ankyrin repeat protein|nr:ankyrin repeat family protein [Alphaproteobacteria bacterium]
MKLAASLLFVAALVLPAAAQVPPGAAEIAAYSGLHAAAAKGDVAAATQLIAGGADLNARDGHRRTPLHVAGHGDVARLLLEKGADANALDVQQYDLITIAAVRDDVRMMRIAIAGGNNAKNVTSPYQGTALIAAAHLGHVEPVRALIEAGAPLDHVNNLGWTALLEAVILGDGGPRHVEIVRLLLAAGANSGIKDRNGATALELARQKGQAQIVRLLEAKPN